MEGLPFLPGNTFIDPTQTKFHRSQSLGYKNGYSLPKKPEFGIGGEPIPHNQLTDSELDELANHNPTLTYGQAKQHPPQDFVPAHVAWDKKVLKFNAWYQQTVHESPAEHYRVRHVVIYYYLEDDSISVIEPVVENSGMPQGALIRRQKLPKNDVGDSWHWKDLNIDVNVTFYGKIFHLNNCDLWTRNFLESEGIEVKPPVPDSGVPRDPYIQHRIDSVSVKTMQTPSDYDKLRQFIEMDRKVLRFYAVWDDRDSMFGELRQFIVHFYLVNDTLEVREVRKANDGRDPFPVLITRHKIPKDRYNVVSSFPGIVMELTDKEVKEYLTPRDLCIGSIVAIYNRRFMIYDCDDFTKAFFRKNLGVNSFPKVPVDENLIPVAKMEIAPYNGYGSMEDSLQSCLSLIPKPPKKDFIKMLENDGRVLRYLATLDSTKSNDEGRRFIISYRLSDDMVKIYEPPVRNSGRLGGKFLERTRPAKPHSTPEAPSYYGPADFYIGAVIVIFAHRFVICNADAYVLSFIEQHRDQFPENTVESLRRKMAETPIDFDTGAMPVQWSTIDDFTKLVREVKGQLKKIAITSTNRKDHMFLGVNADHQGFVSKENIRTLCRNHQLPDNKEIIDALTAEMSPKNPDHISLDDFRAFFESS